MEKRDPNSIEEVWGTGVYETGRTKPPKDHRGPLSACLVVAILAVSVLSAVNLLRLPLLLKRHNPAAPATEPTQALFTPSAESFEDLHLGDGLQRQEGTEFSVEKLIPNGLGLGGRPVSQVEQHMYKIPAGLYLTQVSAGSDAARRGLRPGNVLQEVEGVAVTSQEILDELLAELAPGTTVRATVYADHRSFQVDLEIREP